MEQLTVAFARDRQQSVGPVDPAAESVKRMS